MTKRWTCALGDRSATAFLKSASRQMTPLCRAIFAYRLVRLRLKTGSINVPALAWMVKAKEQNLMRLDASCVIC